MKPSQSARFGILGSCRPPGVRRPRNRSPGADLGQQRFGMDVGNRRCQPPEPDGGRASRAAKVPATSLGWPPDGAGPGNQNGSAAGERLQREVAGGPPARGPVRPNGVIAVTTARRVARSDAGTSAGVRQARLAPHGIGLGSNARARAMPAASAGSTIVLRFPAAETETALRLRARSADVRSSTSGAASPQGLDLDDRSAGVHQQLRAVATADAAGRIDDPIPGRRRSARWRSPITAVTYCSIRAQPGAQLILFTFSIGVRGDSATNSI